MTKKSGSSGNSRFKQRTRPRLIFSFKFVILSWIIILAAFFVCYIILANFTDSFIVEKQSEISASEMESSSEKTSETAAVSDINPVPKTEDKQGNVYLSKCLFVGDSILSGLQCDDISKSRINAGTEYILSNIDVSSVDVSYDNLYLMLGFTELAENTAENVLSDYSAVLREFNALYPQTNIYVMALPPVSVSSTLTTNSVIDEFNSGLLALANDEHVHYLDTNTILKDNSGNLDESCNEEGNLSDKAYNIITDYILYHTTE